MWSILTTVLFVFPPKLPVTPANMNYCIVAFGIILLIAGLTWIFDGRKNFKGPMADMEGMMHGSGNEMGGTIPKDKASHEELPEDEKVEHRANGTSF